MNLVVDESVEREVVEQLRVDGHDVVYVAELAPGITDDEVLDEANRRSALLATALPSPCCGTFFALTNTSV